ncbi:MAG: cob(I)yrinic acid a,c-diamide adenosyltransferase [Thermotaleaceae bacterium]
MEKGFIHVYTGNGKGKTTAALGLALRAAGAGKRVFIAQFVKSIAYSEWQALKYLQSHIDIKLYGHGCFITKNPEKEDIAAAQKGLTEIREYFNDKSYDLFILDEITIALYYQLISLGDVLSLLQHKPYETEVALTGRYAPKEIIEIADLVTEMKEIKHYYQQGILSREGFDR